MRGLTLDNRIVLSPMCQYASTDGFASDWHMAHLGTYALANLGLVITEATGSGAEGPHLADVPRALFRRAHRAAETHPQALSRLRHDQVRHPARARRTEVLGAAVVHDPQGRAGRRGRLGADGAVGLSRRRSHPAHDHDLGGHRGGQARMAQRHASRCRDRRRHDRAALRPRLSGQPVPVAADQRADRPVRRQPRQPHAARFGNLRSLPRRVPGRKADRRPHLRHRLGRGRLGHRGLRWRWRKS